jgi:hypothetical protein
VRDAERESSEQREKREGRKIYEIRKRRQSGGWLMGKRTNDTCLAGTAGTCWRCSMASSL